LDDITTDNDEVLRIRMGTKEKLPLINSNINGIRLVGYALYAVVILVIMGAILLPASAEKETAMSVILEGYNFTAFLPEGWTTGGDSPLSAAEWQGSIWPKAFYNGDSSIGVGVWTIPQNLKDSSNQAIIENWAGREMPLKDTTFNGKPAKLHEITENFAEVILLGNDTLVLISSINEKGKAMDLLDKMEVRQTVSGDKKDLIDFDSESAPSATTEPTKTAYTRDGKNFVSKERMEENIRAGVAEHGEYEEVQVPIDTPITGTFNS
jgi:hypothetical protein